MTWVMTPEGKIRVGKILCLVRNYRAHADEFGQEVPPEPTCFLKPSTSIVHDGDKIVIPEIVSDLQAEAELAVVIGTTATRIPKDSAYDFVLGYAVFLDITARNLQQEAAQEGLPWTLAKGMDTFGPISDIRARQEVANPHRLQVVLRVNEEVRQRASTKEMIHPVPDIIASVSSHMTLERGDVLATGTPQGVPRIGPGDILEGEIESVGRVSVVVEAENSP